MRILLVLSMSICVFPLSADYNIDGMFKSLFYFYNIEQPRTFDSFLAVYPDPPLLRLDEYAQHWDSFVTNLDFSECEYWVDSITMKKRAGLERGIAALIDHPDISSLALEYASSAICYYEWEGLPEGPGDEAVFALSYMNENPESPLEPYLILFLMHRLRAQRECIVSYYIRLDTLRYTAEADSLQVLYDSLFSEAVQHPDPLVTYFALELDSREKVYE